MRKSRNTDVGDAERPLTPMEDKFIDLMANQGKSFGAALRESGLFGDRVSNEDRITCVFNDGAIMTRLVSALHAKAITWRVLAEQTKRVLFENLTLEVRQDLELREEIAIRRLKGDTAATVIQALKRTDGGTLTDTAAAEDTDSPEAIAKRMLEQEPLDNETGLVQ